MGEMIVSRPDIQGGEPCIAGTRIQARIIKSFSEAGYGHAEIIREYPDLTPDQIDAAVNYEPEPTMPADSPTNEAIQAVMLAAMKKVRVGLTNPDEARALDEDIVRLEEGPVDMGETGWAVMRETAKGLAALQPQAQPAAPEGLLERLCQAAFHAPRPTDLPQRPELAFESGKRAATDAILTALQPQAQGGE